MLAIIVSSLIFTEIKNRALSETVAELWNEWELRVLVIVSLILQFVLLIFGNRWKYTVKNLIAVLLWSAYLLADTVANVSLNTLFNDREDCTTSSSSSSDPNKACNCNQEKNPNKALMVFWAPFILLHLGGPDTITAYALEDNELWPRLLPGLVYHLGISLFVFFKFQTNSTLTYIAIPIFFAGFIKYVDRIRSRRSASVENFRNSILAPEPTPLKLIGDGNEKKSGKRDGNQSSELLDLNTYLDRKRIIGDAKHLYEAFLSFKMFTPLFSGLALRLYNQQSKIIFTLNPTLSPAEVFKRVEIELGYVYDIFYTKTTIVHSPLGPIRQSFYLLSSVITLVVFHFKINRDGYSDTDIRITYSLLSGAVVLEVCAFILNVFSNRAMLWMTKHKNNLFVFVYEAIASLGYGKGGQTKSMAQHNLIRFCLEAKVIMSFGVHKYLNAYNILAKYMYTTRKDIDDDLKCLIYSKIKENHKRYDNSDFDYGFLKELLAERGDHVLRENGAFDDFKWSIDMVAFDHSLLLWHIATDLCYYDDLNHNGDVNDLNSTCNMSKVLSDYMLYLLVECSFMMPKGISEVRHRDTCREIMRILRYERKLDSCNAASVLLDLGHEFQPDFPEIPKNKSVTFDGIKLAKQLQSLVTESRWDSEEKWKMISEVWVEMLTYAASHCGWKEHAKQLSQGKELLTHVCLLMAHHGLSEQIHMIDPDPDDREVVPIWRWDNLDDMVYYLV